MWHKILNASLLLKIFYFVNLWAIVTLEADNADQMR